MQCGGFFVIMFSLLPPSKLRSGSDIDEVYLLYVSITEIIEEECHGLLHPKESRMSRVGDTWTGLNPSHRQPESYLTFILWPWRPNIILYFILCLYMYARTEYSTYLILYTTYQYVHVLDRITSRYFACISETAVHVYIYVTAERTALFSVHGSYHGNGWRRPDTAAE